MTQPLSEGFYPLQQDVLDKQIREPKPLTDKLQLIEEQPPAGTLQMPDPYDLYASSTLYQMSPLYRQVTEPSGYVAYLKALGGETPQG